MHREQADETHVCAVQAGDPAIEHDSQIDAAVLKPDSVLQVVPENASRVKLLTSIPEHLSSRTGSEGEAQAQAQWARGHGGR